MSHPFFSIDNCSTWLCDEAFATFMAQESPGRSPAPTPPNIDVDPPSPRHMFQPLPVITPPTTSTTTPTNSQSTSESSSPLDTNQYILPSLPRHKNGRIKLNHKTDVDDIIQVTGAQLEYPVKPGKTIAYLVDLSSTVLTFKGRPISRSAYIKKQVSCVCRNLNFDTDNISGTGCIQLRLRWCY